MRKILLTSALFMGTILFSTNTHAASIDVYPKMEEKGKKSGYEVEVHYQGDLSELTGATKQYQITDTLEMPGTFGETVPNTNKIILNTVGKKYVHVRYNLSSGKSIYVLGGPYNVLAHTSVIKSVEMIKDTNGKYNVIAQVDESAEINSVKIGTIGLTKEPGSSLYKIDNLDTRPTKITVNLSNSEVEEVNVLTEPTVNMGAYNINEKYQRGPININITAGTGEEITYKIDGKVQNCGITSCVLNINENGTLGIYNKKDKVTTGVMYAIKNIDKGPLDLVLSGERNESDNETVDLEWNYPINIGTLECTHNGVKEKYSENILTGRQYQLTLVKGSLECEVKGSYGGTVLTSNRIYISPIFGIDFSDSSKYRKFISSKVKLEESRAGKTYYVNSGASDQKNAELTLPIAAFK